MKVSGKGESKYIAKEDLQTPQTATIATVREEIIKGDRGDSTKPIMYFEEKWLKPMVLNITNCKRMIAAYGDETEVWKGKRVELYFDPNVEFGGEIVGGCRVRVPGSPPANTPSGHAGAVAWTLDECVSACERVGISKADLIAHLKGQGTKGFNSVRDTPVVQAFMASKQEVPLGGDDEIPW